MVKYYYVAPSKDIEGHYNVLLRENNDNVFINNNNRDTVVDTNISKLAALNSIKWLWAPEELYDEE